MDSTVSVDGFSITSNHESAQDMQRVLRPIKPESAEPRIVTDAGKEVPVQDDAKEAKPAATGPEGDEPEPVEPVAAGEKPANPRHDAQARITELARKAKDATDRAERAEARAAEIERARAIPIPRSDQEIRAAQDRIDAARPVPADNAADPKPSEDNFNTYAEFLDARDDWRDRQKEFAQHQREQASARGERVATVVDGFLDRVSGVPKSDPGRQENLVAFMASIAPEVAGLTPSFRLPPGVPAGPLNAIADEIVQSEHAKGLLLHFTKNPDEFQRVAALRTPREIARAMATIETRLDDATAATIPERAKSRATPPVRAVTGSPVAASAAPAANDPDFDKYVRYMAGRNGA